MTLLLLAMSMSPVAEAVPSGKVSSVTLFPDRAQITRTLAVKLDKGVTEVVFEDLPAGLDQRTLQVVGDADNGARILGLDTKVEQLIEDQREAVAALEASIEVNDAQLKRLADQKAAAQQELTFLAKVNASAATQLSHELLFREQAPTMVDDMASVVRRRTAEAQELARAADDATRALRKTQDALRRELQAARGASQWSRRSVAVTLESSAPGSGEVSLSYVISGASWLPTYEARGRLDQGEVSLTLSALVQQNTGEDWSSAALTLSTARPSAGIDAPTLSPFWLDLGSFEPSYDEYYYEEPEEEAGDWDDEDSPMDKSSVMRESKASAPPSKPMARAQATVSERIVATSFTVDHPVNVPGDGTRRKVEVAGHDIDVALVHWYAPQVDSAVWLLARGDWTAPWPLLPGVVHSFVDDAYMGAGELAGTGTGGELELGFGRDDAVVALPEVLVDITEEGWRRTTVSRKDKHTVTNGRSTPVTLELQYAQPVAREGSIKVWPDGDPPDSVSSEKIATYTRTLAGGESAVVTTGYFVKHPNDAWLEGL